VDGAGTAALVATPLEGVDTRRSLNGVTPSAPFAIFSDPTSFYPTIALLLPLPLLQFAAMLIVDEIRDLKDIQRAGASVLTRIDRLLDAQGKTDHFCNNDDCYHLEKAEKEWWTDLAQVLRHQRKCIIDRLQLLETVPEYADAQKAIREHRERMNELNTVAARARYAFDRRAYESAVAEVEAIEKEDREYPSPAKFEESFRAGHIQVAVQ
jgi:hypothetical protein